MKGFNAVCRMWFRWLFLASSLFLVACSSPVQTEYFTLGTEALSSTAKKQAVSSQSRYSLSAEPSSAAVIVDKTANSVGISRIQLPDLLNRKEMVIRKDAFNVAISDTHQWGGELRSELTLALVDQLQQRLPKTRIQTAPWELEQTPEYEFSLQVTQFDGTLNTQAQLRGRWQLLHGRSNELIEAGSVHLSRPVDGDTMTALVQAQSRLIGDLAASWVAALPN